MIKFYNVKIGTMTRKGNLLSYIEKVVSVEGNYSHHDMNNYFVEKYSGFCVDVKEIEEVMKVEPPAKSIEKPMYQNAKGKRIYNASGKDFLPKESDVVKNLSAAKKAYSEAGNAFRTAARADAKAKYPYLYISEITIEDGCGYKFDGNFTEYVMEEIEKNEAKHD